jgi:hypothetical protein
VRPEAALLILPFFGRNPSTPGPALCHNFVFDVKVVFFLSGSILPLASNAAEGGFDRGKDACACCLA